MELSEETKALLARLEAHAENTSKRTERLETAIVGDPAMGNKGVIRRIEDLEKEQEEAKAKQRKMDRKMVIFGAAGTGAIFGIKGLWDKFLHLF